MRFPHGVIALVALAAAVPAAAQMPAGPQFRIDEATATHGFFPAVAAAPGGFVVTWRGGDADAFGVMARRLDAAGAPLGPAFLVNTDTSGDLFAPRVAAAANGDFVVSWMRDGSLYGYGVFARAFDAAGQPRSPEVRVDPPRPGNQYPGSMAADASGNFVVVWSNSGAGFDVYDIVGRRLDRLGRPVGADFRVNAYTTASQGRPDAAFLSDGSFVVSWDGPGFTSWARRFSAGGSPEASDIVLDPGFTTAVAAGRDRTFTAVRVIFEDPLSYHVTGRWYGESGPIGPDARIDDGGNTEFNYLADVASDAVGGAWIVWQSETFNAVFMRRFTTPGTGMASITRVTDGPGDTGSRPAIASDAAGNVLVVWRGQHEGVQGIFAQRYGGVVPAALAMDTAASPTANGNGMLEPGETIDVRTTWRSVHGATLDLAGGLSSRFSEFPGATITDGVGAYGIVGDGATATCADCYGLRLDPFSSRPPGHVDVPALETLAPTALALRQRWRMHVGDSFTDVPRGSLYYRAAETVLHNGVAGGCAAGLFCPAAGVTREQIAVFALKAKEGPAYVPPACTNARFTDVPVSSPFCPWVEELARRGVTGGCGGGRYCPGDVVAREQMSVLVLRTLDTALQPPACTTPLFADVPADSPYCRWIEELARRQVATGCGGGNFCPAAATLREQMAVIATAAFGLGLGAP
jgi:hypothetical protein